VYHSVGKIGQKVIHDTELLYDLKYFPGIIIGESAGALLQFKRYFITAKNNFTFLTLTYLLILIIIFLIFSRSTTIKTWI